MKLRKSVLVTPVALATLALIGCGSGSDNNSQTSSRTPQAGDTQTSKVLVDGVEVQKTTYRVYSVADDKGNLSDIPLTNGADEKNLPHVLIAESVKNSTSGTVMAANISRAYNIQASAALPKSVDEYKSCYSEFWQAMQKYYPKRDTAYIAQRLNYFNMTVDELCIKQASSNLTMDEYIDMFQVVLKYWPNDPLVQGKVADFFVNIGVTPGTFKRTLVGLGYRWEDFARRLSNDNNGAVGFANDYKQSPLAMEPYLRNYMEQQQPGPIVAFIEKNLNGLSRALAKGFNPRLQQAMRANKKLAATTPTPSTSTEIKAYVDIAEKAVKVANDGFSLAKDIWTFITPDTAVDTVNATTTKSYIISAGDTETINYGFAKSSKSQTVTFLGEYLWEQDYKIDMYLQADYDAINPTKPGKWVPNFQVIIKKAVIDSGYKVNGTARVSNVVNRGAVDFPIPEAQVDLTLSASNWSVNRQNFQFIVNGANGATYKFQE